MQSISGKLWSVHVADTDSLIVIIKAMNLLITDLAKPTSVLPVAGFIRSSSFLGQQLFICCSHEPDNFWRAQGLNCNDKRKPDPVPQYCFS